MQVALSQALMHDQEVHSTIQFADGVALPQSVRSDAWLNGPKGSPNVHCRQRLHRQLAINVPFPLADEQIGIGVRVVPAFAEAILDVPVQGVQQQRRYGYFPRMRPTDHQVRLSQTQVGEAQLHSLSQSQPAAQLEQGDQPRHAMQLAEKGIDGFALNGLRQPFASFVPEESEARRRQGSVQHVSIQEDEGVQSLIERGT